MYFDLKDLLKVADLRIIEEFDFLDVIVFIYHSELHL